jgi:putative transposase
MRRFIAQASRDLDMHENVLRKWVKEFSSDPKQAFPGHGQQKPKQLSTGCDAKSRASRRSAISCERPPPTSRGSRHEVRLYRGIPGASGPSRRRFATTAGQGVAWLCDTLGVSRSGFHAWLGRGPSQRARIDQALMSDPIKVCDQRPNVWRPPGLPGCAETCCLHRPEGLMRANALRARPGRRALPRDEGVRSTAAIGPNVLDRQFTADQPNRKWPIGDAMHHLSADKSLASHTSGPPRAGSTAAVIDLFSRRMVGWSMKAEMTSELVTDALMMAIWRRSKPDALLHHSDHGSEYSSEHLQRLMAENGVDCSMSWSGNVWDNAAMESFFSTLKTERSGRKVYRSRVDARADVFNYSERFYSTVRGHSNIGYIARLSSSRIWD